MVDFAQSSRDRHQFGCTQFGWDLACHCLNLFVDQLACVQGWYLFVKDHRDKRETKTGDGTDFLYMHDVAHGNLDGHGDQLFHLLGGQCGGDCNNLYLVVGDVGYGINGKRQHGVETSCQKHQHGKCYKELLPNGKLNDGLKHIVFTTKLVGWRGVYCFPAFNRLKRVSKRLETYVNCLGTLVRMMTFSVLLYVRMTNRK